MRAGGGMTFNVSWIACKKWWTCSISQCYLHVPPWSFPPAGCPDGHQPPPLWWWSWAPTKWWLWRGLSPTVVFTGYQFSWRVPSTWVVTEPPAIVRSGLSPTIFYMTMSCTGWFVNYTVVIYVNTHGHPRLDANEMRSTWWSIINQHCITSVAWSNIGSWAVFSVYNASDKLLVTIWRAYS